MKIYTGIRKGELHPVFCEDFWIYNSLDSTYFLVAVLDGCSSGIDSHFASALMGKVLTKIGKTLPYQVENVFQKPTQEVAKIILKQLITELKETRNRLLLDRDEMLATAVVLLYNQREKEAFIICIGDGFVAIDGQLHEIDQNNQPDYLAYHLEDDFETWFANQKHIFVVKNPQEISLSTDGIDTFRSYQTDLPEGFSAIDFLLFDNSFENNDNMLKRKLTILEKKYGFQPADDVSIVRIKF
jgi:hypothetical protein